MPVRSAFAMMSKRRRIALAVAAAGAAFILPSPASACQVIGMFNAGPGAAPTPICAGHNAPAYSSGGSAGYFPGQGLINLVKGIIRRSNEARERRRALEADPDYQAYMRGTWSYFDSGPVEDGPRRCGASFMKEGKVIMLHGNSDPGSMAMLTFIDLDSKRSRIPRSIEPQLVEVSLDQTGASRATVSAFNHEMGESGSITFAVPSLRAGIDGLTDKLRTRVRMNKRQVFDLEYHSGLEAKARLEECLSRA